MKKISFILLTAFMLGRLTTPAQCTINTANTTPGITAVNPNDSIIQGVVYEQTFQVYIPATYQGNAIDSVHLTVTGTPAGLTGIYLPATGNGETIAGNSQGVICFAGSTFDTVGVYPLTFTGTVYAGVNTGPLTGLPADFSYTFYVKAPPPQGYMCDTVINVGLNYDDTIIFPLPAPDVGYLSGNGAIDNAGNYYPFTAVGEKLIGGIADSVTSAMVEFGYITINPADSGKLIGFYVYNADGPLANGATTGGPGAALDSAFLSLKTIAADVQNKRFSNVAFTGRAQLTSPAFFIVVKLPATPGDTVAIYTNDATTTNGAGYLEVTTLWFSYTGAVGISSDSLGNFIAATVCGNEPNAPGPGFDISPPNICLGTTVIFNNVTLGSPSGFSWNFGDGSPASTLMNPTHTYADTGVYLVSLTASNAGGSTASSAYLTVFGNPVATDLITNATGPTSANGAVVVTVTAGAPPYAFVWSTGTSSSDTLSALTPGAYKVTITDSNTCVLVDTFVVSYTSGINNLNADVQIKIYPNPASDVLFLQSGSTAITNLEIINALGQTISVMEVNSHFYKLETSALATGNYLFVIHTNNGIVTRVVTIMRN